MDDAEENIYIGSPAVRKYKLVFVPMEHHEELERALLRIVDAWCDYHSDSVGGSLDAVRSAILDSTKLLSTQHQQALTPIPDKEV